jgi:hypothetical protein
MSSAARTRYQCWRADWCDQVCLEQRVRQLAHVIGAQMNDWRGEILENSSRTQLFRPHRFELRDRSAEF